ncbi:hypothetical protein [Massilia pseudoviolaceinigra]|uniref:hypothetical protein n=1 Tax=Massilia pseudoviolaceinigra TaxID=3057165 RepID=UPI002796428F|nr:hypothetical protein [Massilia sp. CCM 9206]MDQ1923891.1 hypothetical protein [Massilia sp. CCM 9206]
MLALACPDCCGKVIDAYGWEILSEKFGDTSTRIGGYDNVRFFTGPVTLKLAQNKAHEILDTALNSPRTVVPQ